ncbi:hypothetical protein PCE1_000340 [Barthelona sp. PCE]
MLLEFIYDRTGLLEKDLDSYVLSRFTVEQKRPLIRESLKLLMGQDGKLPNSEIFRTVHVEWHMELLTAAFTLNSTHDRGLISDALSIYANWAIGLDTRTVPDVVRSNVEHFRRLIARALTNVFSLEDDTFYADHVKAAISIFVSIFDLSVDKETIGTAMRSFVGAMYYVFEHRENEQVVVEGLNSLFQTFLDHISDKALWDIFFEFVSSQISSSSTQKKLHRNRLVIQWRMMILHITEGLVSTQEGATQEKMTLFVRMFHLLGNPNIIIDNRVFLTTFKTYHEIALRFPSFRLFKNWLFQAITFFKGDAVHSTNRLNGVAFAIRTLVHLVMKNVDLITAEELGRFIQCSIQVLCSNDLLIMHFIQSAQDLFKTELCGKELILPLLIPQITRILGLVGPNSSHEDLTGIKTACIKILASLLNYHGDTKIDFPDHQHFAVSVYPLDESQKISNIQSVHTDLLSDMAETAKNPLFRLSRTRSVRLEQETMKKAVSDDDITRSLKKFDCFDDVKVACLFVLLDYAKYEADIQLFVNAINGVAQLIYQEHLVDSKRALVWLEQFLDIFEQIPAHFTDLHMEHILDMLQYLSCTVHIMPLSAGHIVTSVMGLLNNEIPPSVRSRAWYVLSEYALMPDDNNVFHTKAVDCIAALTRVLEHLYRDLNSQDSVVRDGAKQFLAAIIRRPVDYFNIDSICSESDLIKLGISERSFKYFAVGKDSHTMAFNYPQSTKLGLFVRSLSGSNLFTIKSKIVHEGVICEYDFVPSAEPALPDYDVTDHIAHYLAELMGDKAFSTVTFIDEAHDNERVYLDMIRPTLDFTHHEGISNPFRLFMGSMNLLNSKSPLMVLNGDRQLTGLLTKVDRLPSREICKISLFFANDGQTQNEIFANTLSDEPVPFSDLKRKMGFKINVNTHKGYRGGLSPEDGPHSYYYGDGSHELMLHIPTEMPCKGGQEIHKKRHVGNDFIHIIFSTDYKPGTIKSQFNYAHYVVYPVGDGDGWTVSITKREEMPFLGPLQEGKFLDIAEALAFSTKLANRKAKQTQKGFELWTTARINALNDLVKCVASGSSSSKLIFAHVENENKTSFSDML